MREDANIEHLAGTAFGEDKKGLPIIRISRDTFSSQAIRQAGLSGSDYTAGCEQTSQPSQREEYLGE